MSLVQKNNWQPSASIQHLKTRAAILKKIRDFFAAREVLEVETPLLCRTSVTDPYIESISALYKNPGKHQRYYLQTSPEYAMKRLLSAGSGCVYQICKAFRQDEKGSLHNPEFSLLEWYRVGFDHHQLMDEMDELLQLILQTSCAQRKTYQQIFLEYLNIDPLNCTLSDLVDCVKQNNISVALKINDRDTWLQLLFSHCIEKQLGFDHPCFVYDFPASQAALSIIQETTPAVASRFEVYYRGVELANGFHELTNSEEQQKRLEKNLTKRKKNRLDFIAIDELFLEALAAGLPPCAGVALGLDRVVMLAVGGKQISEVVSFDFERV